MCIYPRFGSDHWADRCALSMGTRDKCLACRCVCPMHCDKKKRLAQNGWIGPDWEMAQSEARPGDLRCKIVQAFLPKA